MDIHTHIESQEDNQTSIDIIAILQSLWKKKKFIGIVVASATVLSIGISLILPQSFKSTAILLPESEKSKLGSLGGLSDLAALAGVNVGGGDGSLTKLYPTIIKSEVILSSVIYKHYQTKEFSQPVNLIQYWEIKDKTPELEYETALKSLKEQLEVSADNKTQVTTLAIETPEPQLSSDIINTVIDELDKYIRTKRTTNAGNQRKFIEGRLEEVKSDLTKSENNLKEFREKNRIVIGSPQLLLEQERLLREAQMNAAIYTELKKQFEIAKIEEVKNIPVINVMDAARPAAKKEKPKRGIIVLSTFFISFIIVCGYIFVKEQYQKLIVEFINKFRKA